MNKQNKIAIFMVSTPLHLYCSSAIAVNEKRDYTNILIFIDQPEVDNNIYHQSVLNWKSSPFNEVFLFEGRVKGVIKKWKSRQSIFSSIENIIEHFPPDEIYVGNDRRIEFQYAMHICSPKKQVQGIYIDEGIFTYLGRQSSSSFSDKYIDQTIKKMTYGHWWKNPSTVGGSSWIDVIYVAFPEHIHPLLKSKRIKQLPNTYFERAEIKTLSSNILALSHADPEQLKTIDILLTLPHESLAKDNLTYQNHIKYIIQQLKSTNKTVAYKPHPRDVSGWYKIFDESGIIALPRQANFESMLPLLNHITLIADMSSTLLIAKWLRPDFNIIAITPEESSQMDNFKGLYDQIDIKTLPIAELKKQL